MDYKCGITPSLSSPAIEDDRVFGPPALSAYSIAILSAHSSSRSRPSSALLSKTDTKDNTELKDSLKRKFSVHFGDVESGLLTRHVSFDTRESAKPVGATKNLTTSSYNQDNLDNNTSHALSPGLTSTSSGSSFLGRAGQSPNTHTSFNSFPCGNPDGLSTVPLLEKEDKKQPNTINLREKIVIPYVGAGTSALNSHNLQPPSLSLKALGHPLKKSKLSHNLRSLGPPKRASEIEVTPEKLLSLTHNLSSPVAASRGQPTFIAKHSDPFNDKSVTLETSKIIQDLSLSATHSSASAPHKAASSISSGFLRGLENLRRKSPNGTIMIPESDNDKPILNLSPFNLALSPKEEFHVYSDQMKSKPPTPKRELFSKIEKRFPLHGISSSALNSKPRDVFVKPMAPRPVSIGTQRGTNRLANPEKDQETKRENSDVPKKVIVVNSQHYEKLEILGRGGSSKVYKARHVNSKKLSAIKKVDYDHFDEMCVNGFKSEIEHLNKLKDHPRVVTLEDHCIREGSIYLVMECGELDLAHVLQKRMAGVPMLDTNFVRFHIAEVFSCVQAVHQAGIVHSDLKPANFLFVKGLMKIIDFGIANAVPDHTANIYRESQIGTPNYMAPEALIEVGQASCPSSKEAVNTWRVGKPSDVWSCGCILYQMIYGKPPYAVYSGQKRIQAIMNSETKIEYPETGLGNVKVPQSAIILMQGCLDRIPNSRWSVEECLKSDFLKPKIVSRAYVRDLIYSAINFGMENRDGSGVTKENYDQLVETVIKQIKDLNFA